jgi:hypothetical protein
MLVISHLLPTGYLHYLDEISGLEDDVLSARHCYDVSWPDPMQMPGEAECKYQHLWLVLVLSRIRSYDAYDRSGSFLLACYSCWGTLQSTISSGDVDAPEASRACGACVLNFSFKKGMPDRLINLVRRLASSMGGRITVPKNPDGVRRVRRSFAHKTYTLRFTYCIALSIAYLFPIVFA